MSAPGLTLRDSALHAYADGVLAPQRRAEVIAFLAANPDETEKVLGWQRQNDLLRAAFPLAASLLADATPKATADNLVRLTPRVTSNAVAASASAEAADPATYFAEKRPAALEQSAARRHAGLTAVHVFAMVSAAAAIVAAAVLVDAGGGLLERLSPVRLAGFGGAALAVALPDGVVRRALEAHPVFAEDREVPVEFDAAAPAQLAAYLSRRTGANIRAPNLTAQGLRLMGGRVLPLPDGTAAMLVYDGGAGARAALTIARLAAAGDVGLRFQQADSGAVHSARWLAGDEVYVLTSEASKADTLTLAAAVAVSVEAARGAAQSTVR